MSEFENGFEQNMAKQQLAPEAKNSEFLNDAY